jgi:FkbM family methyltransferase
VFIHACLVKKKLNKTRGLFIDCGSNLGQGFNFFKKFYTRKYFDYVLFEPNPYCAENLKKKYKDLLNSGMLFYQKAVGTKNRKVKFFGLAKDEGGKYSQGGSILELHNSKSYKPSKEDAISVEEIDFSHFLKKMSAQYSVIVIKMDIEGGEYNVIADLLEKKLFGFIDRFYVEFHSQYMKDDSRTQHNLKEQEFKQKISNTKSRLTIYH